MILEIYYCMLTLFKGVRELWYNGKFGSNLRGSMQNCQGNLRWKPRIFGVKGEGRSGNQKLIMVNEKHRISTTLKIVLSEMKVTEKT